MNLRGIAALVCLVVAPALAGEEKPKAATYEFKGATFTVHAPKNGRMRVEHPSGVRGDVRIDAFGDDYDPGDTGTAREALDKACQQVLDAVERRKIADKNRPHLEKGLQELYEELAGG